MSIPASEAVANLQQMQDLASAIKAKIETISGIETVKVNGTALEAVDHAVDITVPTKTSELNNDSQFVPEPYVQVFSATLLASGWTNDNGTYTQTVACEGVLESYDLEAPQVPSTGIKATDAALKEGLSTLCESGNCGSTLDGQIKWTCYNTPPTVDLPLRMRRVKTASAS